MRYLSEEWITAADAAIKQAAATAPVGGVVVDQVIDDAVGYRVTIERQASSVEKLDGASSAIVADARFTQSRATAAAVAQGTTDAHQAFLLGHIRFEGNVNTLIERREAFTWLEQTLAPLIAQTTF